MEYGQGGTVIREQYNIRLISKKGSKFLYEINIIKEIK
jgi:hypothetical protein